MLPTLPFPEIPTVRPLPHLGVPSPKEMLAHFLAEHGGDCDTTAGAAINTDTGWVDTTGHVIGFGGVDCADICSPSWPTVEELARARQRIGERR